MTEQPAISRKTHGSQVVIGIPTFRRPDLLARLLDALPVQCEAAQQDHGVQVGVFVVDNDPDGSAHDVASARGIRYLSMPQPGLAAVRNAVIDGAADADALVFIDDDETPEPGWLSALVKTWVSGDAEFVSGRVISTFASTPDPWIEAGGFFRRVQFADGQRMPHAPTNNLLIDLAFVRAHQLRFDEAFGMSGGEDIRFTTQAHALGARILACPDAVVLDTVPQDRATRQWVLRRAYRVGITTTRNEVADAQSGLARVRSRARRFVMGSGGIVVGSLRWAWGQVSRALVPSARGARMVARGAGMAAGALGGNYQEYQSRHQRP